MTDSDIPPRSFLSRLGFGNARIDDTASGQEGGKPGRHMSLAQEANRQLLEAISNFLLDNGLEISPVNLVAAHGAFSGANPGFSRRIASLAHAGQTISQQWLDEATANDERDDHDGIQLLMDKLEATLEAFTKNTRAARSVTSHYNNELEQHVAELEHVQDTGQIITSLADLTRAMLERTRKVEDEMRRSEDEAKSLRRNLEKAKRDAEVDHLTGLPNRRAFESLLEKHYRLAQTAMEALSVAFCDIDHFKRVNDTHGHDAGDRVLKAVAEALARISNDKCHIARHGGEEFVMLFCETPPSQAKARLDEIREQLAERRLINRKTDEPFGQITFSGGVADVFAYANPREALKAADDALYRAKESGRNCIIIAERRAGS